MLTDILRWKLTPRERRLPLYMIVFVTYRCNSRCRTCFYHEQIESPESADLPLDFYTQVARSLPHLLWLHLSGGEPFLRKDLPELVAEFYRHSGVRKIGIPTNGLAGENLLESTRRILDLCPEAQLNIVLSLDGLEKTHDFLRGVPGNYQKMMTALEVLKQIRSKHPRLALNVCTVLNSYNVGEIPELLRRVQGLGVDFHDVGLLRGDFPDKSLELPQSDEVEKILDLVDYYAQRYYSAGGHYPGVSARLAARAHRHLNRSFLELLRTGAVARPCQIGDGFAVIEPNGDVRLCEMTPVIGNLLKWHGDFAAFWNSTAVRKTRQTGLCSAGACTHSNFQTRNFLLNPGQWWRAIS
jgi:MoaA/NifB/PqqE/SkfB family radical SAM enzyme